MTNVDDRTLLRRYHEEGDLAARQQLIEQYMSLVRSLARRYSYRGEQLDDLVQIGAIGLIKAIDRFDVDRGVELTTYATPNIIGEIKRHFRDKGWSVRVPRGLQELNVQLSKLIEEQTVELGRSPTIPELAKAAGAEEELVVEALESGRAYSSVSLSTGGGQDEEGDLDPLESLGAEEPAVRGVGGPGRARARVPRPRRAGAEDPPSAVLRGADPVADRAAGRDLADARVTADPAGPREDPRGDRDEEEAAGVSAEEARRRRLIGAPFIRHSPPPPRLRSYSGNPHACETRLHRKSDSYNQPHAHHCRAPRGLPLVLRVEGPQAPPVGLARPAGLGSLDPAQQRGHAAPDALLPRPRDAAGATARRPSRRSSARPTSTRSGSTAST